MEFKAVDAHTWPDLVRLFESRGGPHPCWCMTWRAPSSERATKATRKASIDAAVEHAAAHGAEVVEAYPVGPDAPSYRFMGFVPAFQQAGFVEVARAGKRRHVMRRVL